MPNVQYSYIFKNRTPKTWIFLLNIFLYSYTFCYWTNELLSMLYLQIFRLSCGEKWYRPAANLEAFQAWTNTLTCIKHSRKYSRTINNRAGHATTPCRDNVPKKLLVILLLLDSLRLHRGLNIFQMLYCSRSSITLSRCREAKQLSRAQPWIIVI